MALTVDYDEITRAIARRLGYPMSGWSTDETTSITDALRCGLRWFYFPTGENTHEWTFIRKSLTINLVSGTNWYTLPMDFERVSSAIGSSVNKHPLVYTNESSIRLRILNSSKSGNPEYCAVRNAEIAGETRYEIGVYPTPDAASTLQLWYVHNPGIITAVNTKPAGGVTHAETILAACLAAAEAQQNPETLTGEGGIHMQIFQNYLASSIATDKTLGGE